MFHFIVDFSSIFCFNLFMTNSTQQRRDVILASAYRDGFVAVRQLADDLDVSEATVRRDLHGLAAEGLLQLNHGGASVVRGSDHKRRGRNRPESPDAGVRGEEERGTVHD